MRILALAAVLAMGAQDAPKRTPVEIKYDGEKKVKFTVVQAKGKPRGVPLLLALPPGPGSPEMVNVALATWERETWSKGWVLVVPQVLGPTLEAEAEKMIPAIFETVSKNYSFDKGRVVLAGASNGGLGAFHAAVAHPDRFKAILVMPGGWEGAPEKLKPLKGRKVRLMVGEKDAGWKELSESTHAALKDAGADSTLEVLPGQEHVLKIEPKKLFEWMQNSVR